MGAPRGKKDEEALKKSYNGFKLLEIFYDESFSLHRQRRAKCLCDCGKEFTTRVDGLSNKKGCKKCGQQRGGKNRILENFEAAKNKYYHSYFKNAKARNLEFSLTREEFDSLISKNCHYCGISPQDQSYLSKSTKKYDKFYANGIDRIKNENGYKIDNVITCCTKCNMMKKTLSYEEFLEHVFDIYLHFNTKDYNNIFLIEDDFNNN